jgi:ParB family transcriptional regulator, chromosome partitioning protein
MTRKMISMSPFRCRMWALHDRFEATISEESCREEIDSFTKHGQLVPVLGRPLRGDPDHDVELIYGARRLFVARHIGQELAVELRDMSDREAIVSMDIENRLRSDISAYERGMSYTRWLRGGHFQSQDDIARELKTSASQVSRLLKMARLPSVVVDAFREPAEIRETWGLEIIEALDDPQRRQTTLRIARAIAARMPRPPGHEVYRQLLSAVTSRSVLPLNRDRVVKDAAGNPVFRIRRLRSTVALLVPAERITDQLLAALTLGVVTILQQGAPTERRLPSEFPERIKCHDIGDEVDRARLEL